MEYKWTRLANTHDEDQVTRKLNEIHGEGWELVTVVCEPRGGSGPGSGGGSMYAVWKRGHRDHD